MKKKTEKNLSFFQFSKNWVGRVCKTKDKKLWPKVQYMSHSVFPANTVLALCLTVSSADKLCQIRLDQSSGLFWIQKDNLMVHSNLCSATIYMTYFGFSDRT